MGTTSTPPRSARANRRAEVRQVARFAAVGVINTLFGFGVFALLHSLIGLPYLVALTLGHVVAVLEAFAAQRLLVFRVRGSLVHDLMRFWSIYLLALAVNFVSLPALVEIAHMPVLRAQALITVLIALGTYLAHRNFTFRRRGSLATR